jgi:cholest-4-en-3-one 26-monooxygenase
MDAATRDKADIDLTDPMFFAVGDPDAVYRRFRREDPVHWTKGRLSFGFWSVFRYKESQQVYAGDNRTFSIQAEGNVLPPHPEFESGEFQRLTREGANLSSMDGMPHNVLRKAFSARFAPTSVATLEGLVRQVCVEILNDVLPRGSCDFAVDVAAKLPLMVIADIMGIPHKDWDQLYHWTNMFASPDDPEFTIGDPMETATIGLQGLNGYCLALALERRRNPGDDLISTMALAEIDGKKLTDEQLAFNGLMFFNAGHETTRNTLCSGLAELSRNQGELARLREFRHDPKALRIAVEEFVRWMTPLNHQMRTAMEDTELGDRKISKGDRVVVWNVSANRDEAQFPDPYRFDCQRSPNVHLGFGFGKHFCLGAHLARLEMQVMLEYLLDSMHDFQLAAVPDVSASNLFPGIKHMPITFTPHAAIAV